MRRARATTGYCAMLVAFGLNAEAAAATSCADPAADIEVALVSKTGPAAGRVRITGVVKNSGNAAWTPARSGHRLRMVLAQKNSEAQPDGEPVEPPVDISQLSPGQQWRIDHQMDWEAKANALYPKFIVRFSNASRAGSHPAPSRSDCRADNNRKEITAADVNRLFGAPSVAGEPLKVQSYRLLGGVGINTVEATLVYNRASAAAGKITASVAAPYSGTAEEVPIAGNSGTARIRVNIPCDRQSGSGSPAPAIHITYQLWGALSLPGGSSWVASRRTVQSIPYRELCGAK